VTNNTLIFAEGDPIRAGPPLRVAAEFRHSIATCVRARADDVKQSQLSDDEALARQLQRQEAAGLQWQRSPRGGSGSPEELRMRLQEILQMMPPNDRHRPLVQRLHDQLVIVRALAFCF